MVSNPALINISNTHSGPPCYCPANQQSFDRGGKVVAITIKTYKTMNIVLDYLQSIHPLPEALKDHLQNILKRKEFSRKERVLKEGQVCRNVYFIEKGLFRCYSIKNGAEICSWFMKEQDVCIAVESFLRQQPSQEFIEAMEDSTVHFITYEELQHIYRNFPEFNFTGRVLTEQYYMLSEQRSSSMRLQRSHERFAWLSERFPELLQRVPAKHIASYLGITEVTLSVIRGKR
jgi:CRP/FNR family transcriptional regulator, anaerobic regulatory protein